MQCEEVVGVDIKKRELYTEKHQHAIHISVYAMKEFQQKVNAGLLGWFRLSIKYIIPTIIRRIIRRISTRNMKKEAKEEEIKKEIKNIIESANLNFLIGAGCSQPAIKTVGNIENELNNKNNQEKYKRARQELKKGILRPNLKILRGGDKNVGKVMENYKNFLKNTHTLCLMRGDKKLSKTINLFTTNYDIFFEKALDKHNFEWNDGFSGIYDQPFDLSNFKKRVVIRSQQFDFESEIPVFNLVKIHGSVTWKKKKEYISASHNLDELEESLDLDSIDKIGIVLPSNDKFKNTVIERQYYDLLRFYANELEKETTVLFVIGFSFKDEHIKEMTVRALNSNPSSLVYYFSHEEPLNENLINMKKKVRNNNLIIKEGYSFDKVISLFEKIVPLLKENKKRHE